MALTIFVPKEANDAETRVAISPDTAKRFTAAGHTVIVESGAGTKSSMTDQELSTAGAQIGKAADIAKADIVLLVRRPASALFKKAKKAAAFIAIMDPYDAGKEIDEMGKAGISAFAMEFMPRITRAQSMDVLSSQANLAGYQAVIDAAAVYDRAMPMMMTAAGTVPAAKVFVMGAGVAGLQAIATAKRLGAVVSATDVRPAAKEQVASLGGKFIAVEDDEFKAAETAGGYAKEMSDTYKQKQAELVASHIAKQDIVITTALIPGRPAPKLISKAMVDSMKPGSVIIDLAVERGGNVEGARAGETILTKNGVSIVGHNNMPGRIAASASLLYAKNLYTFVETLIDKEAGTLAINQEDELVKATLLTHDGAVVHPNFAPAQAPATKAKAEKSSGDDASQKGDQ